MLRDHRAAAEPDVGMVSIGKTQNKIEHHRCPRCAGAMNRLVDPQQTHIGFEQCEAHKGSFLDAGALTDLAMVSMSDFFRRFTTPNRR